MKLRKGFVSFEGGEGCGKSTQARLFFQALQKQGIPCILTREPGGTKIGKKIRRVLFSNQSTSPVAEAEVLLFFADRAQHVKEVILPHLKKGEIVLCDRYFFSTLAYQWGGRGFSKSFLFDLHSFAAGNLFPYLTFYIDIPPEVGLARKRRKRNRFDDLSLAFHKKVQRAYKKLCRDFPERIVEVNGNFSKEVLFEKMWQIFQERMQVKL